MRHVWFVIALGSGCIEGEDPNSCRLDRDCSNGRLCSRMQQCEPPENLFDLTAHWTFNSVTPTTADPGRCVEFDSFKVGASDVGNGFGDEVVCAEGVGQLPRVPASMTTVKASAYKLKNATEGTYTVVGSAEVQRAGANDVTLAFQLP
jgi:hypothetical protein